MRSIHDLLKEEKKIWVYLKDQETKRRFAEEVNQLGARYFDGSQVTKENCSPIMAVHPDLKIAHLMVLIWNASFTPSFQEHYVGDTTKILKVDYAALISGDPNYLCRKSEFIPTSSDPTAGTSGDPMRTASEYRDRWCSRELHDRGTGLPK